MADTRIANVYARALFEAAQDAGTLEATGADLSAFVAAMRGSRELTAALYNPMISSQKKKQIVAALTEAGDRIFINGLNLLIDKRHADLIADVQEGFARLLREANRIVEVEIVSAVELPEETRARIRSRIEAATRKKIEMKATVSKDIVGGLILKVGDVIVDGSLKARLSQLRARLVQA